MSCNYAEGLSPYLNKGKLGLKEKFDSSEDVGSKVVQLAEWISSSKHTVIHTGAGISTSAGIPDFRGPKGVWTLEERGLKPEINISFDAAVPTKTHMAIVKLVESGKVQYVVSQNIDGLHLRSGLPRTHISELHGNMFTEHCSQCDNQFVRQSATTTVGQKCLEIPCPALRRNGRSCRGRLHDTILDWEHNLPENDLGMADFHSCIADLSICLGTTLQIVPSGNLPLYTKKFGGRLVICNLQPTKHDRKADLLIHSYVDDIMIRLMELLNLSIPEYSSDIDPTKNKCHKSKSYIDWTIPNSSVKLMRTIYESKCCKQSKKRGFKTDDKKESDLDIKQIKKSKSDDKIDSSSVHNTESMKNTSRPNTEMELKVESVGTENNVNVHNSQNKNISGNNRLTHENGATSTDIKMEEDCTRIQDTRGEKSTCSENQSDRVIKTETNAESVQNNVVNINNCQNNANGTALEINHGHEAVSTVIKTELNGDNAGIQNDTAVNEVGSQNNVVHAGHESCHENESATKQVPVLVMDSESISTDKQIHKNFDMSTIKVQS